MAGASVDPAEVGPQAGVGLVGATGRTIGGGSCSPRGWMVEVMGSGWRMRPKHPPRIWSRRCRRWLYRSKTWAGLGAGDGVAGEGVGAYPVGEVGVGVEGVFATLGGSRCGGASRLGGVRVRWGRGRRRVRARTSRPVPRLRIGRGRRCRGRWRLGGGCRWGRCGRGRIALRR